MKAALAILSISILLGSCHRNTNQPLDPRLGRYVLSGYGSSDELIFTGEILFTSLEQNYFKGHCTVVREKNAPHGVVDQSGDCEALIEGNKIELDFAPSLDDAGLIIEAEFDDGSLDGVWKLDGFVTSGPLGKFVAVKSFRQAQP